MVEMEFRRISKNVLKVDKYQRGLVGEPKLRKMIRNWSWERFGAIIIAERRDGHLYIVDGQQRWTAACRIPEVSLLPCMVFRSEGPEHEALIFMECGTQKTRIDSHSLHKAAVIAGDPYAVELESFVRARGYEFSKNATPKAIDCIRTIEGMYGRDDRKHPEILEALQLCMTVSEGKYPIRNDLFRGMACICGYGIVLDSLAIEKLQRAGKAAIDREIANQKAANGTDGGRSQALGILKIANYQRTKHRISLPSPEKKSTGALP
jgi:hypothetical protein